MSEMIGLCRRHLILGVACGLSIVALAGHPARAGNVTIIVNEAGTTGPVLIFLGSGLEGPGATSNNVTADVAAVNAALDAGGYDFHFNALGAIANSPASGTDATLFLTGQVFRTTGGGDRSITIDATQNDYTTLAAKGGILTSFSTANFFAAPGGISQVGTSYFAASNAQDDTSGPSTTAPTLFPPGGSAPEPPIGVPQTPFFSLTNRVVITLAGDTTGGANPPIDQFTHSTTVTAIPEPASVAMLGMGMPVAFMGLVCLRRRRATVCR